MIRYILFLGIVLSLGNAIFVAKRIERRLFWLVCAIIFFFLWVRYHVV
mgnify:CR=1 FL=1